MEEPRQAPGPLEPEKHGETSEPGSPQPETAEVESARLLAGQAPGSGWSRRASTTRRSGGWPTSALDLGQDLDAFVRWAREQAAH